MKVRIKKSPSHYTGDQFDYSLVSHPTFSTYGTGEQGVKNTIGGVPREEANIEAEGGETIIGDLNNDGNIEHFTITGKRHSKGGVPMNVPPGSFIFSDTKKMRIKDRDVLDYFGMGGRSGGYTPAEISKRYKLNEFMQTVNSSDADPFAKRTAQDMLDKNMKKLAELAAYQEMMKGNQPPAVSQQILGGQEEMKNGGMVKMPGGGGVNPEYYLRPGQEIYVGKQKVKIAKIDDNWIDTDYVHFDKPVNGVSKIPKEDFLKYFNQDKQYSAVTGTVGTSSDGVIGRPAYALNTGSEYQAYSPIIFGSAPQRDISNFNALVVDGIGEVFAPNNQFAINSSLYKVINPMLMQNGKRVMQVLDTTTNQTRFFNADTIRDAYKKQQLTIVDPDGTPRVPEPPKPSATKKPVDTVDSGTEETSTPTKTGAPASTSKPAASKPKASSSQEFRNFEESFNSLNFAYGGTTNTLTNLYDFGGYVFDPAIGRMVKMAEGGDPGEKEIPVATHKINGKTYNIVRRGNVVKYIDPATNEVAYTREKKKNINTYDPDEVKKLEEQGIVINKAMDIDQLATTPGLQGQRTDNERIFGARNWAQGKEFEDFKNRHKAFLDANPNFDPTKKEDVKKFQRYYNDDIRRQAKEAGFDDKRISELVNRFGFDENIETGSPNALDGNFGQYAWSRPTFTINKKTTPAAAPAAPAAPAKPAEVKAAQDFNAVNRRDPGGMWTQNQNAIMAAATAQPFYGDPSLFQVDMMGFNPQLEEYSAKNAMLQSNLATIANQMAMTGDAATSRAAMLGAVGRANEQGAGIIEGIQNRNVATTNQAAMANAEINNREAVANTELRKKFVDESTVYGQQLQNFFNNKMQRSSNAVNRGLAEMQNTNMVESMYPQFTIDRFTGAVVYDPTSGLSFDDDITTMNNSQNFNPDSYAASARSYYESIKRNNPGISDDEAYKQAYHIVNGNMNIASRGQKGAGFMQAMQNSRMQQRYGGQTPEYAIGGPFFYDNFPF